MLTTGAPPATMRRMLSRTAGLSTSTSAWALWFSRGQTSGCLPGTCSLSVMKPCWSASIPISAASAKVTAHRWPVTRSPRACAASIVQRSTSRGPFITLNQVAPFPAHSSTKRRASSGEPTPRNSPSRPVPAVTYGPAMRRRGPGIAPASTRRLSSTSWSGSGVPAVIAVVTPSAR